MCTRTQNSHQRYSGGNVSKSDTRVDLKGTQRVQKKITGSHLQLYCIHFPF